MYSINIVYPVQKKWDTPTEMWRELPNIKNKQINK